jgi:hypothetical protein
MDFFIAMGEAKAVNNNFQNSNTAVGAAFIMNSKDDALRVEVPYLNSLESVMNCLNMSLKNETDNSACPSLKMGKNKKYPFTVSVRYFKRPK